MIPGEVIPDPNGSPIQANLGLETHIIRVANTGDRPIQVGSHYHFFETNTALKFDRAKARGFAHHHHVHMSDHAAAFVEHADDMTHEMRAVLAFPLRIAGREMVADIPRAHGS